ncbi:hypothetical protein F2Q69_00018810 [Brassica cretica]|uniref:Uncharacterized protein n=1 Tax=Brassica cretica TaxID=69181 RepID=A0A8S9QDR5_BRACR|nr:hypothetical protein F2Q69_00018810 [Brassica cretica]
MFSELGLPLVFEDCRTGPPREPRAGRTDASWFERVDAEVASCLCWIGNTRQLLSGSVRQIVSALVVSREQVEAERRIELRLRRERETGNT